MGDISVTENRSNATLGEDLTSPGYQTLSNILVTYRKTAADGAPATATANDKFFVNGLTMALRLLNGKINPDAALVQDTANKARVQIKTDDGAGGTPNVCLEWETNTVANGGTGSWSTGVFVNNAGSGNDQSKARLPSGAALYFAIAKDGTGVVVPILSLVVHMKRVD